MAPPDEKRIKFCRYCDGVIEWGTEVCPHCGETLKMTEVDELDFVSGSGTGAPPRPSARDAPEDEDDEEPETIEFDALDLPPDTQEMPVLKPVAEDPPVVKPLPKGPPVVKPRGGKRGPPVVKPMKGKGKGRTGPPVMKPISPEPEEPPVLSPIEDEAPASAPVEDCPLCAEPMELRGGACQNCEKVVCVPCLMRANGMRAGRVMEMNRVRWGDRSKKLGPEGILCPQCGEKGVELG